MPSMSEPEFAASLGKEVYDRYNLAINPARVAWLEYRVERLYSRPRTLSYSLVGTRKKRS